MHDKQTLCASMVPAVVHACLQNHSESVLFKLSTVLAFLLIDQFAQKDAEPSVLFENQNDFLLDTKKLPGTKS